MNKFHFLNSVAKNSWAWGFFWLVCCCLLLKLRFILLLLFLLCFFRAWWITLFSYYNNNNMKQYQIQIHPGWLIDDQSTPFNQEITEKKLIKIKHNKWSIAENALNRTQNKLLTLIIMVRHHCSSGKCKAITKFHFPQFRTQNNLVTSPSLSLLLLPITTP